MGDQFIGEIRIFSGNYAPEDWALCDGKLLPIQGHEALYSLLGTVYGGDGKANFGLPDLRGRLPVSQGTPAYSTTNYVLGQKDGTENVTLTEAEMPYHEHTLQALPSAGTTGTAKNNYLAQSIDARGGTYQDLFYLQGTAPVRTTFVMNMQSVTPAGGGNAHTNVMPCTGINFIIALNGVYPSFQ